MITEQNVKKLIAGLAGLDKQLRLANVIHIEALRAAVMGDDLDRDVFMRRLSTYAERVDDSEQV